MTTERAVNLLKYGCRMPDFCDAFSDIDESCEIACHAIQENIERENPKSIPYKNLKNFVHRPIFIVDGNVRCWTILVSVNDDFAHFVESEDCGVRLISEGCGITWFAYEHEPKGV